MNQIIRISMLSMLLMGAILSTSGCRHVPIYQEPQGYSSSYDRAVQAADPLGEAYPVIKMPRQRQRHTGVSGELPELTEIY